MAENTWVIGVHLYTWSYTTPLLPVILGCNLHDWLFGPLWRSNLPWLLLSQGLNAVARVFGGRPAMATSSLGKMQAGDSMPTPGMGNSIMPRRKKTWICLLKVIFYRLYHGIHHYLSPPFGIKTVANPSSTRVKLANPVPGDSLWPFFGWWKRDPFEGCWWLTTHSYLHPRFVWRKLVNFPQPHQPHWTWLHPAARLLDL